MHKQTGIVLTLVILALVAFAGKWYIDSRALVYPVSTPVNTNTMKTSVDMGDGNADKSIYSNDLYKFAIDFPATYHGVTVVGKPGERGDFLAHLYFLWAPGSKDQEEVGSVKIYAPDAWATLVANGECAKVDAVDCVDPKSVVLTTDQYVFVFGGVAAVRDGIDASMLVGQEQLESWIRALK